MTLLSATSKFDPSYLAFQLSEARSLEGLVNRGRVVRNDIAPLILVAVIAVAAVVALILVIGAVAAYIYYCQSSFGKHYWPAFGVPTIKNGFYYFACKYIA